MQLPGESRGCIPPDLTIERYYHLLALWSQNLCDAEAGSDVEGFWLDRLDALEDAWRSEFETALTSKAVRRTLSQTLYPARKPYLTAADIIFLRACGIGFGGAYDAQALTQDRIIDHVTKEHQRAAGS